MTDRTDSMSATRALAARLRQRLAGTARAMDWVSDHLDAIAAAAAAIGQRLQAGGRVLTCGNGGSAAEAMHLAEELIGRYRGDRPALPATCLNADATALTCIANDFGYENVFARQCEALCGEGDVLVALSTSGNSENVVRALQVARERRTLTIGLLGKGGGPCAALCDIALIVDVGDSAHVQEAHLVVVHLICEAVEDEVRSRGTASVDSSSP